MFDTPLRFFLGLTDTNLFSPTPLFTALNGSVFKCFSSLPLKLLNKLLAPPVLSSKEVCQSLCELLPLLGGFQPSSRQLSMVSPGTCVGKGREQPVPTHPLGLLETKVHNRLQHPNPFSCSLHSNCSRLWSSWLRFSEAFPVVFNFSFLEKKSFYPYSLYVLVWLFLLFSQINVNVIPDLEILHFSENTSVSCTSSQVLLQESLCYSATSNVY